jgi:hypothetical protein
LESGGQAPSPPCPRTASRNTGLETASRINQTKSEEAKGEEMRKEIEILKIIFVSSVIVVFVAMIFAWSIRRAKADQIYDAVFIYLTSPCHPVQDAAVLTAARKIIVNPYSSDVDRLGAIEAAKMVKWKYDRCSSTR